MAEHLLGAPVAAAILAGAKLKADALKERGIQPTLALVRVGEDPASLVYLRKKSEACAAVGIRSQDHVFADTIPRDVLLEFISCLNGDRDVHGILVQFPLPAGHHQDEISRRVDPRKDVDGFHPLNAGLLAAGMSGFVPCTPLGVVLLLEHSGIDLAGKHVVIVGRSQIVGRPLSQLLSQKRKGLDATVTLAHSRSGDIGRYTREADLVVAAMGRPNAITGEMIKPGAVVIDVGINRIADPMRKSGSRLVGDVEFDSVEPIASRITPVPGGVGPLTVACLCRNTVAAAAGEGSLG